MPINLTVRADVVDITTDTPRDNDVFLVDTNVWFWLTYTRASASGANAYQTTVYPNFIQRALTTKALLSFCGISLAELAGVIEGAERKIHNDRMRTNESLKYFRHNFPPQRAAVVNEISTAFNQVETMASAMDVVMDGPVTRQALAQIAATATDLEDAVMVAVAAKNGVTQVITDDCDFAGMPNVTVFTANQNVVKSAKAQGRLKVR